MSDVFQEVLDVKADVTFEPARVGEVTHYVADISNAKKLLDYSPKTDLKTGLRAAAEWYSNNFDRPL